MKTLPGVKIIGFIILALTVALGVYAAATQHMPEPAPGSPNVVVKFGLNGTPLAKVSYERALKIIKRIQKDPNLYLVQNHDENGAVIAHEGNLKPCKEDLPNASPTPAPTPSPSPAPTSSPGTGPNTSATVRPSGAKTQTSNSVALTLGGSQEFYKLLNSSTKGEHRKKRKHKDE